MQGDKYSALWVSHSSSSVFLKCPRAYFLSNVYRDPQTGHKINLMSPPLALGQAVHEVIESLSVLPNEKRFHEPLIPKFLQVWKKVQGKRGGFFNSEVEKIYKNRGKEMLRKILDNPGPLSNLAVKIQMDLPYYWLSEEENIILCGKIDWLEYLPENEAVHIIDFKTGKKDEAHDSLQLPIYHLLVHNCQKYKVKKASYWYLERASSPALQPLPNLKKAHEKVLAVSKKIKLARQLRRFKCSHKNGCQACRPLEKVIRGEAEFVGVDEYKQDIYVLKSETRHTAKEKSLIL
jgi:ATP-dependent helicase/DNAse subunit B